MEFPPSERDKFEYAVMHMGSLFTAIRAIATSDDEPPDTVLATIVHLAEIGQECAEALLEPPTEKTQS